MSSNLFELEVLVKRLVASVIGHKIYYQLAPVTYRVYIYIYIHRYAVNTIDIDEISSLFKGVACSLSAINQNLNIDDIIDSMVC